jgi:hypothetical protein
MGSAFTQLRNYGISLSSWSSLRNYAMFQFDAIRKLRPRHRMISENMTSFSQCYSLRNTQIILCHKGMQNSVILNIKINKNSITSYIWPSISMFLCEKDQNFKTLGRSKLTPPCEKGDKYQIGVNKRIVYHILSIWNKILFMFTY